jgi:UDP-N-acetylmuramate--alanine ligase
MNSMATLLVALGKRVSGSDVGGGATLDWLAGLGVTVYREHAAEHVADADLVIASAAVPADNPELVAARTRGVPIMSHAQALGALMATKRGIGVAGTHGKSTTTALIAHVLATAGRDPTLAGGAEALDFGASSRLGHGPELVAEADEYGRRFLELHPEIAVITGIEPDHLDYYRDFAEIVATFRQFVHGMPPDGVVVTSEDDPTLASLTLSRRRVRYGRAPGADWRLRSYEPILGGGAQLVVASPRGDVAAYSLRLIGRHNAENALAAVAVAHVLGVDEASVREALATFRGTRRRFETKLRTKQLWIVDDYAHHPTEIRVNLAGARDVHRGPIWAVFQPHTTHRTAALLDEFATAFGDADHVIVTPIFRPAGREAETSQLTSADLVRRTRHPDARSVESFDEAVTQLQRDLEPNSLVITLGAGDISTLADRLARVMGDES